MYILGFIVFAGFGMIKPVGDVDIYPNGGLNQSGCPRSAVGNIINLVTLSGEGNIIFLL